LHGLISGFVEVVVFALLGGVEVTGVIVFCAGGSLVGKLELL
jgi:hypothetical protein